MQKDYNAYYWKARSVKRNAENKELKKRINELKGSRDKWKEKYNSAKDRLLKIEKEVIVLKKTTEKILNY